MVFSFITNLTLYFNYLIYIAKSLLNNYYS